MREAAGSYRLPARYVAQLVDFLESTGIDRAGILRTARIRSLDASTAQIAYRLGYTDVASFVRSFRARTGRTPGSVRA